MKNLLIGILLISLLSLVVTAQININPDTSSTSTRGIINIPRPSSISSGGNVTNVSSGDGCILIAPNTGAVIVTFNTSCGGSSPIPQNSTLVHCSNVTGNLLCQTQSPTFAGATINGLLRTDVPAGFGESMRTTLVGGLFNLGHITTENGFYQYEPFGGFDLVVGNLSKAFFQFSDGGIGILASARNNKLNVGAETIIESNGTKTSTNSNSIVINGTYVEVNNTNLFKCPNCNITSLHQNYNMSTNVTLGTLFTNGFDRPILVQATAEAVSTILTTDSAFFQIFALESGVFADKTNAVCIASSPKIPMRIGCSTSTVVQPSATWQINATTANGGTVSLKSVWITVI